MNTDLLLFLLFFSASAVTFVWPMKLMLSTNRLITPQWIMAIYQILIGVSIIFYAASTFHIVTHPFVGQLMYKLLAIFLFPTFYIYLCALAKPEGATLADRRIAFIPPVLFGIAFSAIVFHISEDSYSLITQTAIEKHNPNALSDPYYKLLVIVGYYVFHIILVSQAVYLSIKGYFLIKQYRKDLLDFNPSLRKKVNVARVMYIMMLFTVPLLSGIVIIGSPKNSAYLGLLYMLLMAFSVLMFVVGQSSSILDLSAAQMAERRLADELRNQKTEEK